ncbi:hypothetical protein SUNI508_02300 [Seiridium unicorne]|uniref:Peptidase S54 rhomboid domain-containing protein n=1 Tax=Seiridium unicorne TaxID=138068 RepID=A0ABR2UIB5_9PEZI
MLRAYIGRRALPRLAFQSPHILRQRVTTRHFSAQYKYPYGQLPPVRILGPALWCVTVVGTIYLGLAAFEVRQDVKKFAKYGWKSSPDTYDDLAASRKRLVRSGASQGPVRGSPLDIWSGLPETEKVLYGNIALNTSIYAICALPSAWALETHLVHAPVRSLNYTMLTSMFGHVSAMHLLFNMYCLYSFGSDVARTPTFQSSGSHLAAFYLSSGILSSMGAQIEAIVPSRRFISGKGASGAIMALIGVFAMSYPNAQIGIILLPGSVDAQLGLSLIAAFETYGLIFGIPFLRWGHSVHLAGLAVGVAYAHFGGQGQIWNAARRVAFNQMRRLNMV